MSDSGRRKKNNISKGTTRKELNERKLEYVNYIFYVPLRFKSTNSEILCYINNTLREICT